VLSFFGLPVNTATGNMYHDFVDFNIAGRSYSLAFTRTYNSASASTNGPLGYGWNANHQMSLSVSGNNATVTQENGSTALFTQSGGTWNPSAPRYVATLTNNADGTWTFVRRARNSYTFNAAGQLTSMTDLNGYTTTLAYTGGNLTSITDPAGRTLSITWSGGHITSVTDPNVSPNRSVSFLYADGRGNLTDAFDVGGGHWQFTYDANHRMTNMKDPRCFAAGAACNGGQGIVNVYDAAGRVTRQTDQLGRQTTFDYTSITSATKVIDPAGNVEVDYYNYGLLAAKTKGYGTSDAATWRYAYDTATLAPVAVVDPNGQRATFAVDSSGNVLTSTDPLGRQTVNTYNSFNQVLTTTDPNGVATTYTYDAKGNLTSSSRPLVGSSQIQTTTYNHDDAAHPGDVTSMIDPDGKTWTYGYDANGYRNSVADLLGNRATSVFNNDGWVTSSVSPKGNVPGCGCADTYTTTYGHNAFGQVTTVRDPLGHITTRGYDANQNLVSLIDGMSNQTTYVYDLANQLVQTKRADTPQTVLTTDYNPDGTVQAQKDGKGNPIQRYTYDHLARVQTVMDALGSVTTYSHDGAGNLLTKQDPGGNCSATPKTGCTTHAYDAANQLTGITYSDGATPNVTNLNYDGDGQRTGMTDGTGSSTWAWDSLHRLTSYKNGAGYQVQFAYNLRSLATTITYPGTSQTVTRGYDDAGRWTSVQDWLGNTTTFGYDENSNLRNEILPVGTGVVDTFTVDAADHLMSISVDQGATNLFAATYTRDAAHQLTSDSSATVGQNNYKYTPLNQVCYAGADTSGACSSPPAGSQPFRYDAADNLVTIGGTTQQFNVADELCWTYSGVSSNDCSSPPAGATIYTYDTRGNRTAAGTTTLTYDQANRLTSYVGATTATYAYDGDGLRQSKTTSGSTSQFLWDVHAGLPLLLQDGPSASPVYYVYGPGGRPLEQITGSTVLWLHHDQLGSTRLVTDSVGASQRAYSFDPYGNLIASTGTAANPFQFAGEYTDIESGFYYLRARYYDPTTAQFISRDPAVAQTRQPYPYVAGNPLNSTDPSGLDPLCLYAISACGPDWTSQSSQTSEKQVAGGIWGVIKFLYNPQDSAAQNFGNAIGNYVSSLFGSRIDAGLNNAGQGYTAGTVVVGTVGCIFTRIGCAVGGYVGGVGGAIGGFIHGFITECKVELPPEWEGAAEAINGIVEPPRR
jgi:RHS repeat-associated protein